ncbi:MAG: protein-disulfide reductase DsbD [Porticoccaceae bacterium]|nr:protein-disulfide reductase DsbD [Porticoccaceae bacterium]
MDKLFKTTLILLTYLLASLSFAQNSFSDNISSPAKNNRLASPDAVFLPVAQVYQVAIEIKESELILNWSIVEGYYLYRDRFNFSAVDATSQLEAPIFETGKRKWDDFFEKELEVYYTTTSIVLPYKAESDQMEIQIESQGCADAGLCYPPYKQWLTVDFLSGKVEISNTPSAAAQAAMQGGSIINPRQQEFSLGVILIFALLGGMILNLMPCVFPVLSIKALSFTMTHQTASSRRSHGLAYTVGVVSSFVGIAFVMLSLRAAGEAIGWGFQLQSPLFVMLLIYLFFIMGLAFSGYLEIGSSLMSIGQSSERDESLSSSFMTGVLATTVASPCTAPFMGPALGFAIAQPSYLALLVFAFLGLGMALPFVLLAWIPSLTAKLPRPGAWMDSFKQFLAFPLYITGVWLIWVVGRQTSVDIVATIIIGLVLITMSIWLTKLRQAAGHKITTLSFANLFAALCLIGAITIPAWSITKDTEPARWEPYSQQRLSELRQAQKPVFVNLTADWCITCLANEKIAFTNAFYQSLSDNQVTYLKGDWTNNDPEITKLLNQFQRSGVPLYLVYPEGEDSAEVLPQILLENTLINAIQRSRSNITDVSVF